MQVKSVRHNGCADDTDRNQERLAVEKLRQHAVPSGLSPIDWRDQHLDQVGDSDCGDEAADRQFDRAKSEALQAQHRVDDNRGRRHAAQER